MHTQTQRRTDRHTHTHTHTHTDTLTHTLCWQTPKDRSGKETAGPRPATSGQGGVTMNEGLCLRSGQIMQAGRQTDRQRDQRRPSGLTADWVGDDKDGRLSCFMNDEKTATTVTLAGKKPFFTSHRQAKQTDPRGCKYTRLECKEVVVGVALSLAAHCVYNFKVEG